MTELFLFTFGVIGMTHIIVDSSIFAPVRDWMKNHIFERIYRLFECYQCTGAWCGSLLGAFLISHDPWAIFAAGCAGSFLATFAATFLNYLEARSIIDIGDEE
jgi:hypothetical protein